MGLFLLALIAFFSFELSAECSKTPLGLAYYFTYQDAKKDEYRFHYSGLEECQTQEKFVQTTKPPFELCSCEPIRKAMVTHYWLYCHKVSSRNMVDKQRIQIWSHEKEKPTDWTPSSSANLEACAEAKKAKEDAYYKGRLEERLKAQQNQLPARDIQKAQR